MDRPSYYLMKSFVRRQLKRMNGLSVCDVGSCNVDAKSELTFRELFWRHKYIGLDITEGKNVDVVSKELYRYPFDDETFDVVVSGNTIEHIKDLHKWVLELKRITKKEGLICIVGPSAFHMRHLHPVDCWRVYPDGMKFLLEEIAGLEVIKIRTTNSRIRTVICMGIGKRHD